MQKLYENEKIENVRLPCWKLFERLSEYGINVGLVEVILRQGCCFSPLLFIIFIKEFIKRKLGGYFQFANRCKWFNFSNRLKCCMWQISNENKYKQNESRIRVFEILVLMFWWIFTSHTLTFLNCCIDLLFSNLFQSLSIFFYIIVIMRHKS